MKKLQNNVLSVTSPATNEETVPYIAVKIMKKTVGSEWGSCLDILKKAIEVIKQGGIVIFRADITDRKEAAEAILRA